MKLKTLKDFEGMQVHDDGTPCLLLLPLLKAEAIKWVKADLDEQAVGYYGPSPFLRRWMKRLNITEEDLK